MQDAMAVVKNDASHAQDTDGCERQTARAGQSWTGRSDAKEEGTGQGAHPR